MRFEEKADTYHENAFIQKDLVKWGVEEYLKKIEWGGKKVMELGAGTGQLTEELVKLGMAELHATDNSEAMLAHGEVTVPNIKWSFQNAWDPEFKGYDVLVSSSLLHWAEDPVDVLKKWKEIIGGRGDVVALFYIEGTLKEFEFPASVHWRDLEFWRDAFELAGYNVVQMESSMRQYLFKNSLQLLRFLHKTGTTEKNMLKPSELLRLCRQERMEQSQISSWHFCGVHGVLD